MSRDPTDLPPAKEVLAPFADLPVDWDHPRYVARLAIRLFDLLAEEHGLGRDERELLWRGALLHDVGYARGWQSHHKSSFRVLLDTPIPGLSDRTRGIVACIARYHRGADPKGSHPVYGEHSRETRDIIEKLAAILRVADGLDRGQVGRVEAVDVRRAGPSAMTVVCYSAGEPTVELWAAAKKASLFESVFGRSLSFEYGGPSPRG
jgi:exopolyphosphatase/guanosine-5'-triphosphate,3'-diphosphate pyrophosphatase